jgi:ribosome biogenesis GTPase / thiamine phosphate phosphatase
MPFMAALAEYGFSPFFAQAFAALETKGLEPGRVVRESKGLYRVQTDEGERVAEMAGRLRHEAASRADLPAVGDFVALRPSSGGRALVHSVLPRRSVFVRRAAGLETQEQILAANVDTVFLVSGLDRDFNPRRIERYLVMASESGARPVIVLNKADLCDDVEGRVREVEAVAPAVPIHPVAGKAGEGLAALEPYLQPAETVAFLGSSGVGKSTLINRLLGAEVMATHAVRESDQRGRHTTSHRQILRLPGGGLVIDTPGMRELQLWAADDAVGAAFEDVEALAATCRFRDCTHEAEPGCAVQRAAADGTLPGERLESYRKLQGELKHLRTQQDLRAQLEQKRQWRNLHRAARKHQPRG